MIVSNITLYEEMFSEYPKEVVALMGYETLASSGFLSEHLNNEILSELDEVFEKGAELEFELKTEE